MNWEDTDRPRCYKLCDPRYPNNMQTQIVCKSWIKGHGLCDFEKKYKKTCTFLHPHIAECGFSKNTIFINKNGKNFNVTVDAPEYYRNFRFYSEDDDNYICTHDFKVHSDGCNYGDSCKFIHY